MRWLIGVILFCLTLGRVEAAEPKCYRDLANHFFDDDKVIMQALSLYRVTQSSWTLIINDLHRKSRHVLRTVKDRARSYQNNPLEPFQSAEAEKLLMYTLLETFQSVLNSYLVMSPGDISGMFDYIRRQQPGWSDCFLSPEGK